MPRWSTSTPEITSRYPRNHSPDGWFRWRHNHKGRHPMRTLAILLGGAAMLAACSTTPPPPPLPPPAVVDLTNPLLAPGFLSVATSANQWEILASQLAQQASANVAV